MDAEIRHRPQILVPFNRKEELTPEQAAAIAGRKVRTIRLWCEQHQIGRKVGGVLRISRVALAMYLDGDDEALRAYLAGERTSPRVTEYFRRAGLTVLLAEWSRGDLA
jgi:hypothetical protein